MFWCSWGEVDIPQLSSTFLNFPQLSSTIHKSRKKERGVKDVNHVKIIPNLFQPLPYFIAHVPLFPPFFPQPPAEESSPDKPLIHTRKIALVFVCVC